jgi:hypothetical protein
MKNHNQRQIICLDDKKIYASETEASKYYSISQSDISNVCLGKRGKAKGLRFAFLIDYENGVIPIFIPYKRNLKRVRCIDTGQIFSSINEAGKEKGILPTHISSVCRGNRKKTGGLRWEYA